MSKIKRITVFLFAALILAANLPLCASAVEVATQEDKAAGCLPVIQIFGQSHNVQYVFDAQTTAENIEMLLDLWGQYTTQVNNAVSLDTMYNQILTDNTYQITQAGLLAFDISSSLSGMLTMFWDFVLSGPAAMTRVDNEYAWTINNDVIDPVNVYQNNTITLGNYICYPLNYVFNFPGDPNYIKQWITSNGTDIVVIPCKYASLNSAAIEYLVICTTGRAQIVKQNQQPGGNTFPSSSFWANNYLNGVAYYGHQTSSTSATPNFEYNHILMDTIVNEFTDVPVNPVETTNNLDIKPYVEETPITLPSTSDTPAAVQIVSDYTPSIGQIGDEDDLIQIGQEATESIFDDQFGIQQDVPPEIAPGEVYVPFLPVTLPNFNFNLSGIWHYVREWISSLSAWFTTLLTVWASLPYAMVVPVYATLVIVIVLGVYKRFFM